jgi:hypothetical protein
MIDFRLQLINLIHQHLLHHKSKYWQDILLMAEEAMIDNSFCRVLLPSAKEQADKIAERGIYLEREPDLCELYADGPADIVLGHLKHSGLPWGPRFLDRPRNMICVGGSGSGRTVLIRNFCVQLDRLNISIPGPPVLLIIFDFKSDYKGLAKTLKTQTIILDPNNNLKIGLNAPKWVPPIVWINRICLIISARIGLISSRIPLVGIIILLLMHMNRGLGKADLNNPAVSGDLIWPPLSLVLQAAQTKEIVNLTCQKSEYSKTLIHNLMGLLQDSGELFECCNGLDINDLLEAGNHIIIDVSCVPSYIMHIIHDIASSQLMVKKVYRDYKCDRTEEILIADECDLLLESDISNYPDGLSTLEYRYRIGREVGVMSIIAPSGPGFLSHHITRNSFYTLGFNQADSESAHLAARQLAIDPRCMKLLGSLPPGECIIRQTQTSWSNAMWCEMDYYPPDRDFRGISYCFQPYVESLEEDKADKLISEVQQLCKASRERDRGSADKKQQAIEEMAYKLCILHAENPLYPVARLFERLGKIHFKIQVEIRRFLEDKKYAEFEETRIGRANVLLMELTAAGYGFIEVETPPQERGRGSLTHRRFSHWIRMFYEKQNCKVILEWVLPGSTHPVDVAVFSDNALVVFEVCISSSSNLKEHIEACFEKSEVEITRLIIIVGTKARMKQIHKQINSQITTARYAEKIKIDVIGNYMPEELTK